MDPVPQLPEAERGQDEATSVGPGSFNGERSAAAAAPDDILRNCGGLRETIFAREFGFIASGAGRPE